MATILLAPHVLEVLALRSETARITAVVQPRGAGGCCPVCGRFSRRVHSWYRRTVLDVPCNGITMLLDLRVRRFFCDTPFCVRRIFTERLPDVVAPSARRTTRLDAWLTAVGSALGGAAGARLLRALGAPRSPDTLLRHLRALPVPLPTPGTAIGIDEFAFRRGRQFGTVIVDLSTRRVLDLLPDVTTETVVAWLRRHPAIRVVSRDRAYNFGDAIRQGAPQARQVADRWHLLSNLGERVEAFLREHKAALRTPRGDLLDTCDTILGRTNEQEARGRDEHQRQVELFERVQAAHARGLNPTAIAKLLGICRATAYKYATMRAPPDRLHMPSGALRPLAAYVPYIYERWNEGCRNAAQIHRELQLQARQVSARTVSRYLTILRTEGGVGHSFVSVEPEVTYTPRAPPPPSLTPRQAAILFGKDPQRLTTRQRHQLDQLFAKDAALQPVYGQVQAFFQMVCTCGGNDLQRWLETVEQRSCPQLRAYAAGLRKDLDAVRIGLTERYSQGPVEGHIHRIKLIKRSGYGRMSFPLLRQRVLLPRAG